MDENKLFEKINANAERRQQKEAQQPTPEVEPQTRRTWRDIMMASVGAATMAIMIGVYAQNAGIVLASAVLGTIAYMVGENL